MGKGLPKKYAKMGFKKGWIEYRKVHGKKKSSPKKSKTRTGGTMTKSNTSSPKKFTVGKALDLGAIAGPALIDGANGYIGGSTPMRAAGLISSSYGAYNVETKQIEAQNLVRGYGGSVNRALEKKMFKMLGIRGPRSKIKTTGDILDYVTYFGKTAVEAYENRGNPVAAGVQAYKTQYGVDLNLTGFDAWASGVTDMARDKWGPYVGQKMVRKFLRGAGIKLPSFNMG